MINNKGLSLVELIVAISIGTIVSGAIAALMTFAIRMYRNESVNVSAQYELQTNVNQIMDTIMGANCFVIQSVSAESPSPESEEESESESEASVSPAGRVTRYAAFGKFDGSTFDGVVFVSGTENPAGSGRFNIYMDRGVWSGSDAKTAVAEPVEYITNAMSTTPNQYLLGEGSTLFRIEPKILTESPKTYVNITPEGYKNPLSIEVELNFQKDAQGKVVDKHVKDEALIRNRISTPIYIEGDTYTLIK